MQNKNICPCCDSKNYTNKKIPVRIYDGLHIASVITTAIFLPVGLVSLMRSEPIWSSLAVGFFALFCALASRPKKKFKMRSFNTCLECGETWSATQEQ